MLLLALQRSDPDSGYLIRLDCASRPGPRGDWLGDALYHALSDRLSSSRLDGFLATCQSSQPRHVTDDHHVSVKERDVLASEPSKNAIDHRRALRHEEFRERGRVMMTSGLVTLHVRPRPRPKSGMGQVQKNGRNPTPAVHRIIGD